MFPEKPAVRIKQMEEAIQLILKMWSEPRATFDGKYFHIKEAMLEPKPVQKPHPPILIGGSGEQLTLRAVARWGDACNVFGDPEMVRKKYAILRKHCEEAGRDYNSIQRTNLTALLVAKNESELQAKKQRMQLPEPFRGYALTVSQAVDLFGQYQDAGTQLLIVSSYKNEAESLQLLASDVMPKFAD